MGALSSSIPAREKIFCSWVGHIVSFESLPEGRIAAGRKMMNGMSNVTGTSRFGGIVALPSEELKRLPPAAPLALDDEPSRTPGSKESSERAESVSLRNTPSVGGATATPPQSSENEAPTESQAASEESQAVSQEGSGESAVPGEGEDVGSRLDMLI